MAARRLSWIVPLAQVTAAREPSVGGKAARLARLIRGGFRVPPGFCIPVAAYECFVKAAGLAIFPRYNIFISFSRYNIICIFLKYLTFTML